LILIIEKNKLNKALSLKGELILRQNKEKNGKFYHQTSNFNQFISYLPLGCFWSLFTGFLTQDRGFVGDVADHSFKYGSFAFR
jgi:hypothetical protein